MLASALEQYREQQRITALGLSQARRLAGRGSKTLSAVVASYQLASIALSVNSMQSILDEQNLDAPTADMISASSLLTGPAAERMFDNAQSPQAVDTLVMALIQDAGRTATAVDVARRPAITGYVRSLNPPSCSRCAVLASRVYRYSTGFQRHPRCDCLMTPTNDAEGLGLITDPSDMLAKGQIRGLSQGDTEALKNGADLGQIVNVRRSQSGLVVGSSVVERAGRLTPQGVLRIASHRTEAIALLRQYGYLK